MKLSKKILLILPALLLAIAGSYAAYQNHYRVEFQKDICEHGEFRRVSSNYSDDLFVPTKTAQEWSNFRSNPPSDVNVDPIDCCSDDDCGDNEECEDGECVPIGCEHNGEWYDVGETRSCSESCSYYTCGCNRAGGNRSCDSNTKSNSGEKTCRSSGNWSSCDADEPSCPDDDCNGTWVECPSDMCDDDDDEEECNSSQTYADITACEHDCDDWCDGQDGCSSGSCSEEVDGGGNTTGECTCN